MKTYKCHKEVQGFKIKKLEPTDEGSLMVIGEGDARVEMSMAQYGDRFNPQVGGYYVKYANGYDSYSPCEVFEKGYTLIKEKIL